MGNLFQSLFQRMFNPHREAKIVMVGLDGAGKTTTLYKMQLGEIIQTVPTIGFNIESVRFRKLTFVVWDAGGQDRIRELWRHYYYGSHAVVWVIDSSDKERLEKSAQILGSVIKEPQLQNAAVLVFANKQDMPEAVKEDEILKYISPYIEDSNTNQKRKFKIQECSALRGEGLYEGFDWLSRNVKIEN